MEQMNCPKCGAEMNENAVNCPKCGYILGANEDKDNTTYYKNIEPITTKLGKGWKISGIICLLLSIIPLCIGFNKMFVYESSEYSWKKQKNAYVGGDAYNYIINANYATAFFVLTGILLMCAIGCGILYYLSQRQSEKELNKETEQVEVKENQVNCPQCGTIDGIYKIELSEITSDGQKGKHSLKYQCKKCGHKW